MTGGKTVSFEYNYDGIRTEKHVSGTADYYYRLDGDQVVEMVKESELGTQRYVFLYDDVGNPHALYYYSGSSTTPTKYYYVLNAQGDVVQLRNSSNTVIANYTYDAWGKLLSVTNASGTAITNSAHIANINPIRYRGYFYDTETKLYYCNSRYYDPQVRRFINADDEAVLTADISSMTQHNLFAYCLNDPVNRVDGNGYWSWKKAFWTGISVAAVGLAVIAAIPTGGGSLVLAGVGVSAATATATASAVVATGVAVSGAAVATGIMYSKPSRKNNKERSTDKPSWVNRDMVDYSKTAHQNATKMMNDQFGVGNWSKNTADRAFSKIYKWLTRSIGLKG